MVEFTELLRRSADHVWSAIFEHPFVVELYSGSLPLEKFRYYVAQDYNYLVTVSKCFSLIASKAEYAVARRMLELAHLEATTEMENYEKLLGELGMKLEAVVKIEPSPTNTAYMNFLLATCALGSPVEGVTSLLPCFWSYAEIASKHADKLANNRNEIYRNWAKIYGEKEYLNLVNELKALVDEMASEGSYKKLGEIFMTASRYEYMFWDAAYKLEKWPL
ncbi:MAG: thiaminase II [Thaumarchaeota archaeon]|nr:thiaminase II [Nitrososphaerota archaeon]